MIKKIILWILLISWCGVIFSFSAKPAAESSQQSIKVSKIIVNTVVALKKLDLPVLKKVDKSSVEVFAEAIENTVRKCAHFGIFMILGLLSYPLTSVYLRDRRKIAAVCLLFCLLYAGSDEIHQIFVAGRSCQIKDVMIDFSGSLTGVGLAWLTGFLARRRRRRA